MTMRFMGAHAGIPLSSCLLKNDRRERERPSCNRAHVEGKQGDWPLETGAIERGREQWWGEVGRKGLL